ncbi:MAG: response regulator transcription factor [Lentisphaerota bacterium]
MKKRVFLVEDHPIVRHGLLELLNHEPDMAVCGEAEEKNEALTAIALTTPDIVIVDLSLRDSSGLDLIKDLKIRHPKLPALVLSMYDETIFAERALRAGARGYVMKQKVVESIALAIRRVLQGEVHISEQMVHKMLSRVVDGAENSSPSSPKILSDRELEVLRLLGEGFASREVAAKLKLSVKTIETHREHLKRKLNLDTSSELVRYAIQWLGTGSLLD